MMIEAPLRARLRVTAWPDAGVHAKDERPTRGFRQRVLREQGLDAWPTPGAPQPLRAESAELVGAWGMQIRWNDGHDTGIYAWSMLRAWNDERDAGDDAGN